MLSLLRRFFVASTLSNYYLAAHILFGGVGVLVMKPFLSVLVIWQVVFALTIGWELIEFLYYSHTYGDEWWKEYGSEFNAISDAIGDCYWVYFVTWIILS